MIIYFSVMFANKTFDLYAWIRKFLLGPTYVNAYDLFSMSNQIRCYFLLLNPSKAQPNTYK